MNCLRGDEDMKNDILKGLTVLAVVFLIVGAIYIDDESCASWIYMIGFTWITVFYFANLERWSNVTYKDFTRKKVKKWQQKKTLKTVSKNT